jgi:two-component system CheB/CheR fusion protein
MSALEDLAANTGKLFDVRCRFVNGTPVLVHNHGVATHLYRIAQEAISNAIKHGKAKSIEVHLANKSDGVSLLIKDDGAGFVRRPRNGDGMGLHIMQYRAGLIGATLQVQPQPSRGVVVVCCLPHSANSAPSKSK